MKAWLDLSHIEESLTDVLCEVNLEGDDITSVKLKDPNDVPAIGNNEIVITEFNEFQIEGQRYES